MNYFLQFELFLAHENLSRKIGTQTLCRVPNLYKTWKLLHHKFAFSKKWVKFQLKCLWNESDVWLQFFLIKW